MGEPTVQTDTQYVAVWDTPRVFVDVRVVDGGGLVVTVGNQTVEVPPEYNYDAGMVAKLVRGMIGGGFVDRGFMGWLNRNVKVSGQ